MWLSIYLSYCLGLYHATINTMQNTFMSFSFGCRVNEAEKQQLDQKLIDAGFSWDETHPDFYIINSCAITGKAEREVRQHIYQTRKKFPLTKIIVTGCSATLWLKNKTLPMGADMWIDNTDKCSIPSKLSKYSETSIRRQGTVPDKFLETGRVMIKIQDGCNRFCSYCIVPFTRGRAKSKTIKEIIEEIQHISIPVQELILTAINTEYFGIDTGETLTDLIDAILTNTTVEKISFGSIHPWSLTPQFLTWYEKNKDNPRFVHFFHIPIQSGSTAVLEAMRRPYKKEELLKNLQTLHHINPNALIATDVIVGFPNEGEKEFEETYEFLKASPITKFHVFRYSPRPGTVAATMKDTVSPKEKRERSHRLIELGKKRLAKRT